MLSNRGDRSKGYFVKKIDMQFFHCNSQFSILILAEELSYSGLCPDWKLQAFLDEEVTGQIKNILVRHKIDRELLLYIDIY